MSNGFRNLIKMLYFVQFLIYTLKVKILKQLNLLKW